MSTAGAIRAGRAFVEIFLEQAGLDRGLAGVEAKLRGLSASIGRIASSAYGGELPGPLAAIARFASSPAGVFSGLLAAGKIAADVGDDIGDLAEKAGTSIEAISALAYAARRADVDASALATAIRKMQITIADASKGSKAATVDLEALGLSAAELRSMLPEEQFRRIADRIAAIQNPTERAAAAVGIFGRSGSELLPLLLQGADGIAKWEARARSLGLVFSGEVAQAAGKFHELLGDLHDVLMDSVKVIGSSVIPQLTELANTVIAGSIKLRAWISDHQEAVVSLLKLTGTITATGIALVVFSKAVAAISAVLGAVQMLLGPIGLLTVAVTALGVAWANAEAKGISFGESVLDLTHKLTGAKNAYSDLQDQMAREKEYNAGVRNVEVAFKTGEQPKIEEALGSLQNQRDMLAAPGSDYAEKKQRYQEAVRAQNAFQDEWDAWKKDYESGNPFAASQSLMMAKGNALVAAADAAEAEFKKASLDVERLDTQIASLKRRLAEGLEGGQIDSTAWLDFSKTVEEFKEGGISIAAAFLTSMDAYWKANRPVLDQIDTLRAKNIVAPEERDLALVNLEYDRKLRDNREAKTPADEKLLEEARQQELTNIRDKYAQQAAERAAQEAERAAQKQQALEERAAETRRSMEERLSGDVARLKVESTLTGIEKERALLQLKHDEEMQRAVEAGANLDLVRQKQAIEAMMVGKELPSGTTESVTGTFSSAALSGLGTGNGIQERMESHLAEMKTTQKTLVDLMKSIDSKLAGGIVLA